MLMGNADTTARYCTHEVIKSVAISIVISIIGIFVLELFSRMVIDNYAFSIRLFCIRVLIISLIMFVVYSFRPKSLIWRVDYERESRAQKAVLFGIVLFIIFFFAWFIRVSGQIPWLERGDIFEENTQHTQNGNQYNILADSILDGKAYLDLPVSDILLSMDNPYDTNMRAELNSIQHDKIYWDYAYYDGHYYCYFGVLPCLLTFLPFKLITGLDLRNDYVVLLFGVLSAVAAMVLARSLARTYFKKISFGAFICGFFTIFLLSGILEQIYLPRIYPIPMLSSLFFSFLGLSFWVNAKYRFQSGDQNPITQVVLGAICIALTLGCRPQYILTCLFAFPIFWKEIKKRFFFSKKGLANTLAVIAPFIIVLIPICMYNYVRFDSFTNFGASYNLTGADMTSYTFDIPTIAVHALEYLFLLPQFITDFPFLYSVNEFPIPPILWTNETFYAGFCILSPVSLICVSLFSPRVRNRLKDAGLNGFTYVCILVAVSILVIDCYVSGVTMRYFTDFGWQISLATIFIFWSKESSLRSSARATQIRMSHKFQFVYFAVLLFGLLAYSWTFLGTARIGPLWAGSPDLYSLVKSLFFL